MRQHLRFALASTRVVSAPAFEELRGAVHDASGVTLEAVHTGSYPALAEALDHDRTLLGWAPPLIAHDLLQRGAATPLAAVARRGGTTYYGAIVAAPRRAITQITHLRRTHVGWISPLSAAGYVVPRLYLESVGASPDQLFARQSFFGTHARAVEELLRGSVDVIATYARLATHTSGFELDAALGEARVIAAAGPIPGDVIVAGSLADADASARVRGALSTLRAGPALQRLMNVERFVRPTSTHSEWLTHWHRRASQARLSVAARAS